MINLISRPIVSIVLISYNSEKYIIEALDSVFHQTYRNIELIISDDSSKDSSFEIIKDWSIRNKNRFNNLIFKSNQINLGITKNIIEGIKLTKGEYIKLLSADDVLCSDAIEKLLLFSINNSAEITFSGVEPFHETEHIPVKQKLLSSYGNYVFSLGSKRLKRIILYNFPISTLGLFFSKNFYEKHNIFDERYGMIEDYILVFSLLYNYKVDYHFLNQITIYYRIRIGKDDGFYNSRRYLEHKSDLMKFQRNNIYPIAKKKFPIFLYISLINYHRLQRNLVNSKFEYITRIAFKFNFIYILTKSKFLIWKYFIQKNEKGRKENGF